MNTNLKQMIDNIADGDMNAAGDAFLAAAAERRGEAWEQARIDYAQNAFKEVDLGQVTSGIDTGITGHPDEVDEQRPSAAEIRKMSAVDQATQAHVSGDIEKRDAILKNRAASKKKKQVGEQSPSAGEVRKMSAVDQATMAHVKGDIKKRDAILKAKAKSQKKPKGK